MVEVDINFTELDNTIVIEKEQANKNDISNKSKKNKKVEKTSKCSSKNIKNKKTEKVEVVESTNSNEDNTTEIIVGNEVDCGMPQNLDKSIKIEKDNTNEKIDILDVKNQPTIANKNSFLSAVNEMNKQKDTQLKEELSQIDMDFPYIKREVMTNAEKQLYHFMKNNLYLKERVEIFPKVRLGDIVDVDDRVKVDKGVYLKVAYKHVDFLIVDKDTLDIICVVELDDYTHEREHRKERDQFVYFTLQTVGINMQHIKAKISNICKADLYEIESIIADYYKPICHYCHSESRVKVINKSGIKHRFYSCTKFPTCRWTLDCDS